MSFHQKPLSYNLHQSYAGIDLYLDLDDKDRIVEIGFQLSDREMYFNFLEKFCQKALGKKLADLKVSNEPGEDRFVGPLALLLYRLKCEWYDAPIPWNKQKGKPLEQLVCRCFGIYLDEIKSFLQENPMSTVAEMTGQMKIGGGCTSCLLDLEKILKDFRSKTGLVTDEKRRRYLGKTPVECLLLANEIVLEHLIPGKVEVLELRGERLILSGSQQDYSENQITTLKKQLKEELGIGLIFQHEDSPYCI